MYRKSAYIVFVVGGVISIIALGSSWSIIGGVISVLVTYVIGSIFIGIDQIVKELKKANEYLREVSEGNSGKETKEKQEEKEVWMCTQCNRANTTEYLSCRNCGSYRY